MNIRRGFLLLGGAGEILGGNAYAEQLLGKSMGQLQRTSFLLALGKEASPEAQSRLTKAFKSLSVGEFTELGGETQVRPNEQQTLALEWKMSAMTNAYTGCAVVFSFWETSVAAVAQPVVSGYRDVFEHTVEGLFRSSVDGHYLQVNPALAHIYGYGTPAEMVSELRDLNTQLYLQPGRRAEFVRLMTEQGFVSDFESEVPKADGTTIWIAEFGRVVRDGDGTPIYFEGSVIDVTARKHAEARLRESEERYRNLVEMTGVLPWEASLEDGNFTYVGPQAVALLGYPVEEWLREGFWQRVVHSDDRTWVPIVRAEAIEKRRRFECEYRLLRPDRQCVWVREIVNVLADQDGRPFLGGFLLDVTFRRQSEESLRESQHFIEQIAAASPTISYLYDPSTKRTTYVNGRVPDILGYNKQVLWDMQPLFLLSLAHPDEMASHEAYFDQWPSTSPEIIRERQFRLRNAVGGWLWLQSRERLFRRETESEALSVIGTIEDITLQRNAIEELEGNEWMFRRLAESTGAVPFDFDLVTQRFTYVGPQAEKQFGHPVRRWFSPDFWTSFVAAEDMVEGTRFLQDRVAPGALDFQTEFCVCTASGGRLWVRQIVHRSADEEEWRHVRGFLFDVTETHHAEDEKERSRLQLRKLAAKGQAIREEERISIAREIHDELGQALTLLKIELSSLGKRMGGTLRGDLREEIEQRIGGMEGSIDTTLQIIRRILEALRPPLLEELGLREAIEWQMQEFSRRLGVRYEMDATPVTHLSLASSLAVFRIFQEILTNIARHAKASRVKVHLCESSSGILMRVEDNGVGIDDVQAESKKRFGLLGMRERAWSVGGALEIHGSPGRGTAVTLRIPANGDAKHVSEIAKDPEVE